MPMTTRAAVSRAPGEPLTLESLVLRDPLPDEVLVEIRATGLCHSDLLQMDGSNAPFPFPVVPGHEGAGVVVACGSAVTSVTPGDHVVPLSIPECGECAACCGGKTNLCKHFYAGMGRAESPFSLEGETIAAYASLGTFANHVLVKEMNVARIPREVPFDLACTVGCCVATGVGAVLYTAQVEVGSVVVVLGLGGVGLNVVQGARMVGASRIIGVDTNPERAEAARRFGATDFIDPQDLDGDLVSVIREMTGGGTDYSFECVGNTRLGRQALEMVHPGGGVAVIVGMPPQGEHLPIPPESLFLGRTLMGSFLGNVKTRSQLPLLLQDYLEGRLDLASLVTHRLPLSRINDGFALMRRGESLRTVVTFPAPD